MKLANQGTLTDQDIARLDKPLSDSDVAMFDAGAQGAPPKTPVDPRLAIDQRFQGQRQRLDKVYQGMAKANKIASYGVPAGVLTDQQQARYNQEVAKLTAQHQEAIAAAPPTPMAQMADGGTVMPSTQNGDTPNVSQWDLKEGSFGPAYERHTRTPITWRDLPVGTEGQYDTAGAASAFQAGVLQNNMRTAPAAAASAAKQGVISIDPSHSANLSRDLRHEAAHQILLNGAWPEYREAQTNVPSYPPIARQVMQHRLGTMGDEVPAYMASYDPEQTGVSQSDRDLYISEFLKQLGQTRPAAAQQYQNIANLPLLPKFARGGAIGRRPTAPFAKEGKVHAGPLPALIGEAGNELLIHGDGSQELIDHPQIRQLGTSGTDQVVPLTRPEGRPEILRGSSSVPLDQAGHQMAMDRAQEFAGQFDRILASPYVRTQQSAQPMQQTNPQASFEQAAGLADMGLGALEGQQVTEPAIQQLNHMVLREPDMPFSGQGQTSTAPGDSFNGFKNRVVGGLHQLMQQHLRNPQMRTAAWTHNRVLRVVKGWEKKGFNPKGEIDTEPLINYHQNATKPGGVEHLAPSGPSGQWQLKALNGPPAKGADGKIAPGIYLFRHGTTAFNAESSSNPLKSRVG